MSAKEYEYILKILSYHLKKNNSILSKKLEEDKYSTGKTKTMVFGIKENEQFKHDIVIRIEVCE